MSRPTRTWSSSVSSGGMEMVTGTYTGDGNATQAITGVGFQPKFVIVYIQEAVAQGNAWIGYKCDQDGLNTKTNSHANCYYETDHIISLDADGFTVGDGTGSLDGNVFNLNGKDYTYIAFSSS